MAFLCVLSLLPKFLVLAIFIPMLLAVASNIYVLFKNSGVQINFFKFAAEAKTKAKAYSKRPNYKSREDYIIECDDYKVLQETNNPW